MDDYARQVLTNRKIDIKKNLILEPVILDKLEENNIFTEEMSQTIKAPSTNDDKIDVFLTTLKRRGPNAFDAFIEALQPHHDFLAEILMDEYKALKSKADRRQSEGSDGLRSNRNSTTSLGSYERLNENSQQMCSHCKQTLGKDAADFFAENEETIFIQPNNLTSMSSETLIIGKWLDGLYRKLKYHIFTTNTRELSFKSPKPVTIAMVEKLIDELISMEQMCYKELAAQKSNESLLNLIKDLKSSNNKLNEKVISAEQRTDRYAAQIVDLETKCRNKTAENQSMQTETEGLRSQIISLNERMMKVEEEIKRKHAELEKAQKTVETLKATLDHPTEELQREIRRLNREIFLKEFKLMKMSKSPKKQQQAKKLEAQYEIATTKEYQQVAVGYKQQKQQLPKSSQQNDLQNDLNRKSKVNLELQLPSIEENTQISLTMPKEQLSKSEGSRTTSTHFPTLREGDHFSEHQTDGIDNNVNHTTSLLTSKEKYEENRTILKFPTDNIPTPRERRSPSVMLTPCTNLLPIKYRYRASKNIYEDITRANLTTQKIHFSPAENRKTQKGDDIECEILGKTETNSDEKMFQTVSRSMQVRKNRPITVNNPKPLVRYGVTWNNYY